MQAVREWHRPTGLPVRNPTVGDLPCCAYRTVRPRNLYSEPETDEQIGNAVLGDDLDAQSEYQDCIAV
jgi:hypothetical protein